MYLNPTIRPIAFKSHFFWFHLIYNTNGGSNMWSLIIKIGPLGVKVTNASLRNTNIKTPPLPKPNVLQRNTKPMLLFTEKMVPYGIVSIVIDGNCHPLHNPYVLPRTLGILQEKIESVPPLTTVGNLI